MTVTTYCLFDSAEKHLLALPDDGVAGRLPLLVFHTDGRTAELAHEVYVVLVVEDEVYVVRYFFAELHALDLSMFVAVVIARRET